MITINLLYHQQQQLNRINQKKRIHHQPVFVYEHEQQEQQQPQQQSGDAEEECESEKVNEKKCFM